MPVDLNAIRNRLLAAEVGHRKAASLDHERILLAARREVGEAWRGWCSSDVDGALPPQLCEGCSCPATTTDGDGLPPLCDACAATCGVSRG